MCVDYEISRPNYRKSSYSLSPIRATSQVGCMIFQPFNIGIVWHGIIVPVELFEGLGNGVQGAGVVPTMPFRMAIGKTDYAALVMVNEGINCHIIII